MSYWLGVILGALFGVSACGYVVKQVISECEESLPRSQTCVLIAVPKQETIQEK